MQRSMHLGNSARGARDVTALRLTIELVPRSAWGRSLYGTMARSRWQTLRKRTLAQRGERCEVCGSERPPFVCDEIWRYDDESAIATLTGLRIICRMCSFVKHFGHAGVLAQQGSIDVEDVIAHFCRVNACDRSAFDRHRSEAGDLWLDRCRIIWRIDFGEFASLVPDGAAAT